MKDFIKPDWENSILNVSATFAEFLGAKNHYKTLSVIKNELDKNYKNVVFICLDGLGVSVLEQHLRKDDFLRKNIKQCITSTFPSTTTNATTTLGLNKYPLEHGWLGWTLHFEKINKNIDIYRNHDSQTGEIVDFDYPLLDNGDFYFAKTNSNYKATAIVPAYVKVNKAEKIVVNDENDLCKAIQDVCLRKGKQFAYCYFPEPDKTMHHYGVSSAKSKKKIKEINNKLQNLFNELDDTLIVITADHGHIDVAGYVEFYKDKELNNMLLCAPYLDGRAVSFRVKKGKKQEFEKAFKAGYGKDFVLLKTKWLIENDYFGKGDFGFLLGDFIAVGTKTNKQFLPYSNSQRHKGHHCSLTKEEMLVPLIICDKK